MKKRGDTMSLRIDGKKISSDIKEELKEQVKLLKEEGISVCLAVIQVGSDPASSVYVNNKKKACAYIGIESQAYELPEETTQEELLSLISRLNKDVHASFKREWNGNNLPFSYKKFKRSMPESRYFSSCDWKAKIL